MEGLRAALFVSPFHETCQGTGQPLIHSRGVAALVSLCLCAVTCDMVRRLLVLSWQGCAGTGRKAVEAQSCLMQLVTLQTLRPQPFSPEKAKTILGKKSFLYLAVVA